MWACPGLCGTFVSPDASACPDTLASAIYPLSIHIQSYSNGHQSRSRSDWSDYCLLYFASGFIIWPAQDANSHYACHSSTPSDIIPQYSSWKTAYQSIPIHLDVLACLEAATVSQGDAVESSTRHLEWNRRFRAGWHWLGKNDGCSSQSASRPLRRNNYDHFPIKVSSIDTGTCSYTWNYLILIHSEGQRNQTRLQAWNTCC